MCNRFVCLIGRAALLYVVMLLGPGASARAVEYFVAPRGQDTANGMSPERALASIQKGCSMLKAGDTLTILPGEYHEAVTLRKVSGTRTAPVTIRAQRPGTVLIRGDVEVAGWLPEPGLEGGYFVPFEKRVESVADPRSVKHYDLSPSLEEVRDLAGGFFHDVERQRLVVRTPDGLAPALLCVSLVNGCGLALENCSHMVVEGLAFTGFAHADNSVLFGSRTRWGFVANSSEGVVVRRSVSYLNSGGFCLTANCTSCVIEDCEAFGNTSRTVSISNQILGWGVKDCIFRRNRIVGYNSPTGSQDQITFYSNSGNVNTLEENVAIRASFMDKGDAQNIRVIRNISTGPRPQYYRPEDASNLRVQYRDPLKLANQFADPVNGDFRLLPDSPLRGSGLQGADPGPFPYRDEVYFVSPGGDDESPGTSPTKPWKTLKHAASKARPGDTVYLLAGIFEESLAPANSGTVDKPIRFARRGEDRVILDGRGQLPVGIELAGRSHIQIEGLQVRHFTKSAVQVSGGDSLLFSHLALMEGGGDGVTASGACNLTVRHLLVEKIGGTAVKLEQCRDAVFVGNQIGQSAGPRVACDQATVATLWSDRNNFSPAQSDKPLIIVEGLAHSAIHSWQESSGCDLHSTVEAPRVKSANAGLALQDDSPLIGRGPRGEAIGPFRRMIVEQVVPIERARLHSVTATTANLECDTPTARVEVSLVWGDGAMTDQNVTARPGLFHTISLAGLKPGTEYHCQFSTATKLQKALFASDRQTFEGVFSGGERPAAISFKTPTAAAAPRIFHVSPDGDDQRDGLSKAAAWRTINHAASQAVAGDTVLVHSGTYEEFVTIRGTGDARAPVTFRTAPGAVVWMTGSNRIRPSAFLVKDKHHVVIDGFRFRDFLYEPSNLLRVIAVAGGSHNTVRRCFYDGRVTSGYMNGFLGITNCPDFLVENCVLIQGMGEGLTMSDSPRSEIRHCVFYNNNIRALSVLGNEPGAPVTIRNNLICASLPAKSRNGLIRAGQLQNIIADHNGYFDREGETERGMYEVFYIGDKEMGEVRPGAYHGRSMTLEEVRSESGQEQHSFLGNPGMPVVQKLAPRNDRQNPENNAPNWTAIWLANDLHQTRQEIQPLDFHHFMAAPDSRFAGSEAGKPIGLDPAAFGPDFARAADRGESATR